MSLGGLLRELDRRALPLLARGLTRLAGGTVRRRLLLVGTAALAVATVVLVVRVDRPHRTVDTTVGDVARVGVPQGRSIPDYVRASRAELEALDGGPTTLPTYALVSFTGYLAPDRIAPALRGLAVAAVFARVPLADTQTEIVRIAATRLPEDLLVGMARVAARKDREALEYADLSAKLTGDGEQEAALRARYHSGARVAAAEATAYRSNCSCLYAAVVRAEPASLRAAAQRSGVRAVDPAPEVRSLERAVFLPPLPEQAGVARPPEDALFASPSPRRG